MHIQQFLEKNNNRWFVPLGADLIQFPLGAIYAWSVFNQILITAPFSLNVVHVGLVFSVGLATFATTTTIAGLLRRYIRARTLTIISGVGLGISYMLAGYLGHTAQDLMIYIGVLGGASIGIGYIIPIALSTQWFPDRKGLAGGVAVAGFGFGAALWVKLAGSWWWGGGLINAYGLHETFIIYGIVFATMVFIGSIVMVEPRKDWVPEGYVAPTEHISITDDGLTIWAVWLHALRDVSFWLITLTFLLSATSGLMVIYSIRMFGVDILTWQGIAEGALLAGTAMAWYAIFNGVGRITWGYISDVIGRIPAIALMLVLQISIMLTIYHYFITGLHGTGLAIAASIIGFNFGANFVLMPTWTIDRFGKKHGMEVYALVFMVAYGIAGLLGPVMAGYAKALSNDNIAFVASLQAFVADVATYEHTWLTTLTNHSVQWLIPRLAGPIEWMAPFLIASTLLVVALGIVVTAWMHQRKTTLFQLAHART